MTRLITLAQNEALAKLNAALYFANETQLLKVLQDYMDPKVVSMFIDGVGKLCVEAQPSEDLENAGTNALASGEGSPVDGTDHNVPRVFEGREVEARNFQDIETLSRFFTDNGQGFTKTGDTTCIDDYSQRPIQIAADAVVWVKSK